jgi:hypothetical protein
VDLPIKQYKISNFISILASADGMYCGWSMRNFLRFVEFDGEYGGLATTNFKEEEVEYRALDFIF